MAAVGRWTAAALLFGLGLSVALAGGMVVDPSPQDGPQPEIADGPPSADADQPDPPWEAALDGPTTAETAPGGPTTAETTPGGPTTEDAGSNAHLAPLDAERDGELQVHFINVGQADATLVVTPSNATVLIDTGHALDDGEYVLDYLEAHGIERIDYLVATHGHWDHIGGHPAVIETYEAELDGVGTLFDPGVAHTTRTFESYLDAVEAHDVPLRVVREGDAVNWDDDLDVSVLNPPDEDRADELNDDSLAFRVEYDEASVLLPGDAEWEAERRMAGTYGDDLDADLYKAGHHGSNTSSTPSFLARVDPDVAVVSSAYESPFGHPNEEVLATFAHQGVETYWTAAHGSTVAISDGGGWDIRAQANATTDPRVVRAEPPATAHPAAGVPQPQSASEAPVTTVTSRC
ncbi:ComEC/Rec2 family competence protein [Halovivax sp.]|uniref:ComEC/Rec2 family competence protein n=1 Tax=Halovivax sp. TaxID=1935978 RepID=UPI0025BDEDAF|nr:MBL fold metallo-hydrolase [Halovivax sp.]